MKRITAVMLILMLVVLTGCASGPSDEEASRIIRGLVEASYEMNVIYFGDGMTSEYEVMSESEREEYVGLYSDLIGGQPYMTEADLREGTLRVFTKNYASVIFGTFLYGVSDPDSGGVVYARYVEQGDRLTKKIDYEQTVAKTRTYDLEHITILRSEPDTIKAKLQSFVDGEEDVEVTVTVRLEERETDKGTELVWRLDSPTY